jgi:N-methylhydantoinase A
MSGDLRIGVDIGGTFTDVVVRRPGAPSRIMKIPTTRSDPSIAVLEALKRMQAEWGLASQDVLRFVHGTTVATNAVLERKGAKVGVITTEGPVDIVHPAPGTCELVELYAGQARLALTALRDQDLETE